MDFEQISKLKFKKDTGFYDLTQPVFRFESGLAIFPHIVEKEEEMRMDLISFRLYGTTDHTAFLCRLNNIVNPLNIKEGTTLVYVQENNIASFTPEEENFVETVKQTFINLNKKRRVDTKREEFLKTENVSLPPTFNENDTDNVTLNDDGVITIGPGEIG
jgi:hypothetical protein